MIWVCSDLGRVEHARPMLCPARLAQSTPNLGNIIDMEQWMLYFNLINAMFAINYGLTATPPQFTVSDLMVNFNAFMLNVGWGVSLVCISYLISLYVLMVALAL
jgi:hypothetical protein